MQEQMLWSAPGCGVRRLQFTRWLWFVLMISMPAANTGAQDGWNIQVVGQVGGGCQGVQANTQYAYFGEGPNLTILDVSETSNPLLVKRLRFHGVIADVFLSGTKVYVAGWTAGLQIVNVSNPETPTILGSFQTNIASVHVANNRAYVSNILGGVQILNVSNSSSPTLISTISTPGFIPNIWVSGTRAYLAGLQNGLLVYDVTQPSSPVLQTTFAGAENAWDVVTSGSLAYVAGSKLYIVDFRNVTSPTLRGTYPVWGNGLSICLRGTTAYVTTTSGTIHVVDVSDPDAPTRLGGGPGTLLPTSVYVVGTTVYISDAYRGLYILDFTDPAAPFRIGFFGTPIGAHVVRVPSSSRAEVAAYDYYTLDINDPSNPTVFNIYETWYELAGVDRLGNNAFLTHDTVRELLILNISDPSSPTTAGIYRPGASSGPSSFVLDGRPIENAGPKVDVRGNTAVISGFTSGALDIVDVGQPANVTLRCLYPMPSFVGDIDIEGNTAFISNGPNGLRTVDISDSTSPRLQCTFAPAWALSFHRSDYSGQIGDGRGGVWIVDVTNLTSTALLARYMSPGRTYGVDENGWLLYTASGPSGLNVIDISHETSPSLVGRFNSEGIAVDVHLHGDLIYLADKYTGVWILRYTGPRPRGPVASSRRWWLYR